MSTNAAKVHIKAARELLVAALVQEDQAPIVGLIDLAKDELGKALREAKGQKKQRIENGKELPGQAALDMPARARSASAPMASSRPRRTPPPTRSE